MNDDYLERLEHHLGAYSEDDDSEFIDNPVAYRWLTVGDQRAAVAEIKRLRKAERELAEARNALTVAAELIDRLAFDDECDYDHNVCCQAHNLHEHPCPHPLGRQFVEAWRAVEAEQQPQVCSTGQDGRRDQ